MIGHLITVSQTENKGTCPFEAREESLEVIPGGMADTLSYNKVQRF
jgi:hypothetical protein